VKIPSEFPGAVRREIGQALFTAQLWRKLTQIAAAKLIGIKQPDLSNIVRGHYQGFSRSASGAC